MERIYTDTYDFEKIRQRNAVYVDKTASIRKLVDGSIGDQFFLARPRRFGKSLLLSTIGYLFEGRRDLFEGLAIADAGWDWEGEACPVVRIDLSGCDGDLGKVRNEVLSALEHAAEGAGVKLRDAPELGSKLGWLVTDAAAKSPTGKCVLLVDEYDKPLVPHLGTEEVRPFQDFLRALYTPIKSTGEFQRFCLLTGVSKFSKVSVFSSLNNLIDLTMDPLATTLLGYTHDEVRRYFPEALASLGEAYGLSANEAFDGIARWYDGYCFDRTMVPVFNPVSLGRALSRSEIGSYWFETGTPGWLMSYARRKPINVDCVELRASELGTFEPATPNMAAVLFQTGYLTIKEAIDNGPMEPQSYRLGLPNREVADGFNTWLATAYTDADADETSAWARGCVRAVDAGDPEEFVASLESFFASIGYDLSDRLSEQAYQQVVVAILRFIGTWVSSEVTSARGRADMVAKRGGNVFVVELKVVNGEGAAAETARAAIAQIRDCGYAEPYRSANAEGSKQVWLLGITFDCETHNIAAWESELL